MKRVLAWWFLALALAPAGFGISHAQPPVSPTAGQVLTLEEALAIALERQPQIQARVGDYEAARARVSQALSAILPQLGSSWTATRDQSVTQITRGGRLLTKFDWDTSNTLKGTLSQKLFDFGKAFAATDAAKANAESSREDVELQKDLIVLAVKESYFNLLFSQRLVKVNRQALERAELNLRSAKGFFEVGTRPKSDVTRAEVDVANARLKIIQARNAVRLARAALNTAMGIKVDAPTEVKDILTYEPFPVDPPQLVGEALTRRPEYRQIKTRVEAAEATVRQTFRNFFPDLTGNAFVGTTRADMNEIWELGITLSWDIFDGGNKVAKYKEAKASLEAAQARVRALELDIWKEVEQDHSAFIETEERIQAAQASVASAQENFKLAQGRFDAGVGTILELTDAQLALTEAQSTEAQALADYRIAIARLERALGRR
jgi:outer membrane protein TolC